MFSVALMFLDESSLFSAFQLQTDVAKNQFKGKGFVVKGGCSGLIIHEKPRTPRKSIFYHIRRADPSTKFIICHDAINNSLETHPINPLTRQQLVNSLKSISNRTQLIVYCRRIERQSGELTTNIYQELKEADRPVVSVVRDIDSRKAALGEELEEKYSRLRRPHSLELKSFYVVLKHQGDKKQHLSQEEEAVR